MRFEGFAGEARAATEALWQQIHAHPFVRAIGDGTISRDRFEFYLRQDYVYLIDFSRLLAIATAKSEDFEDMRFFSRLLETTIHTEMDIHRRTCERFGIDAGELERTEPSLVTSAYTGAMLRTAYEGPVSDEVAALLPCYAGYVEIAERLRDAGLPEAVHCRDWIASYTSPEMREIVEWLIGRMNRYAAGASAGDRKRWLDLYREGTRFELVFFQMAWEMTTWPASARA